MFDLIATQTKGRNTKMKILVTGARDWEDRAVVEREIKKLAPWAIVVHGGCPTGADAFADEAARARGLVVKVYKADWEAEGKSAGPKRNSKMIREEHRKGDPVALCLAFTKDLDRSRGTKDCVLKARKAGIPVQLVEV